MSGKDQFALVVFLVGLFFLQLNSCERIADLEREVIAIKAIVFAPGN